LVARRLPLLGLFLSFLLRNRCINLSSPPCAWGPSA
jgi:hypothetical protein